jgi:hypothetical protein
MNKGVVRMMYNLFVFIDGRFNELYRFESYEQAVSKTSQLRRIFKGLALESKIVPAKNH